MSGGHVQRRLAFAPLEEYVRVNYQDSNTMRVACAPDGFAVGFLAEVLGLHPKAVYRCRNEGITERMADRLCCKIDLHPAQLWSEWLSDVELVPA